jgi:flagellar hook-length control protein FliK
VHGTDHRKGAEAANTVPEGKPEPIKADNAMPVPSHPMQPQAKTPEVALAAPQPQQPPQQAASGGDGRASEGTAGPASAGYKPADMPAPAALAPLVSIRVLPKGEGSNSKALEIRLDPPELGRVDVKLETAQDGTLKAVLSAERVEALELLRRDQGTLENALRQAGVALGDNAISFSLSAGAGEQDPGGGRHERPDGARAFGEAAQVQDAAMQAAWTAWRDGVLDMKV